MQGIRINVATTSDLTNIKFNLYDNGEVVVAAANSASFDYLVGESSYTGVHKLELEYFHVESPDLPSEKVLIVERNFTRPVLENLVVTYEVF